MTHITYIVYFDIGSTRSYTTHRTRTPRASTCKPNKPVTISGTLGIRRPPLLACGAIPSTSLRSKWPPSRASTRLKCATKPWRVSWVMVLQSIWAILIRWETRARREMPCTMAISSSMSKRQCNARHTSNSSDATEPPTIRSTHLADQSLSVRRQKESTCSTLCLGIMMAMWCPKKRLSSARIWIRECKTILRILARVFSPRASLLTTAWSKKSTIKTPNPTGNSSVLRICTTLRSAEKVRAVPSCPASSNCTTTDSKKVSQSALTQLSQWSDESLTSYRRSSMKSRDASKSSAPKSTKSRAICRSIRHPWPQGATEDLGREIRDSEGTCCSATDSLSKEDWPKWWII